MHQIIHILDFMHEIDDFIAILTENGGYVTKMMISRMICMDSEIYFILIVVLSL